MLQHQVLKIFNIQIENITKVPKYAAGYLKKKTI